MSRILANYFGTFVPDLIDSQSGSAGLITEGAQSLLGAFDGHDHASGRGLPLTSDGISVDGDLDMQGGVLSNAQFYGFSGAVESLGPLEMGFFDKAGSEEFGVVGTDGQPRIPFTFPVDSMQYTGDIVVGDLVNSSHGFVNDVLTARNSLGEVFEIPIPFEENTWTPTAFSGGTEAGAYTVQDGWFARYANMCWGEFSIQWTLGFVGADLEIRGLPFTAKSGNEEYPWSLGLDTGNFVAGRIVGGSNAIQVFLTDGPATAEPGQAALALTGSFFYFI